MKILDTKALSLQVGFSSSLVSLAFICILMKMLFLFFALTCMKIGTNLMFLHAAFISFGVEANDILFTDQLEELRKTKLSRIVCDNSDDIKSVQVYVMVLPDHDM